MPSHRDLALGWEGNRERVRVDVCVSMLVGVHVYACVHVSLPLCVCTGVHLSVCVHVSVCVRACECVHVGVCVHVSELCMFSSREGQPPLEAQANVLTEGLCSPGQIN